jgi:uncharacterized protein (DUF983 family)
MAWFLTKECPHCHEESFGFRELFQLGYSSADQCKACGKPVRNDGFRQFLSVPAILIALFVAFVVFASLPNSLQPFGFLLVLVSVLLTPMLLAKPVRLGQPQTDLPAFTPDPNNDKLIVVSGWSEEELHGILDDFTEADLSRSPSYQIDIAKRYEGLYGLTFPADIHPALFLSLVNYLNYPVNVGLDGHSIAVVGKTTLNSDFEGVSQSLIGKRAILYVPDNDEDYDVVYLQAETGKILETSFSRGTWRQVTEPRMGSEVKRLSL